MAGAGAVYVAGSVTGNRKSGVAAGPRRRAPAKDGSSPTNGSARRILRRMAPFTLDTDVPVGRDVLFDALTDRARLERWLYGTDAITDVSGPLSVPGTTFVQRAIKGIQRPGAVVEAERPAFWHIRLAGFGERADLVFQLEPVRSGTHLRMTVDVRNGPRLIGRIVDTLTSPIERRLWQRVAAQIRDEMAREAIKPTPGGMYILEGGGWLRIGHVIDVDSEHVHLEVRPGVCRSRPTAMDEIDLVPRKMRDYLDLRPLEPKLRSAAAVVQVGSKAMLADGGFGLAHCPMTVTEFRNGRPDLVGEKPVAPDARGRIAPWRERRGSAFGDLRAPRIGAFFSVSLQAMGVDAIGFGLVKLLKQEFRGVHVRVYSNVYAERPSAVDESALETWPAQAGALLEAPSAQRPAGNPHLALTHASFKSAVPQFIATTLVEPDELLEVEAWKLGRGRFV